MTSNSAEIERRTKVALQAIRQAYGTEADEYDATLFVSHHLEELEPAYWQAHVKVDKPDPAAVLDLLFMREHWGGDEDLSTFDFSLPGDVTDYVISVSFDDSGAVDGITMES